MPEYNDYKDVYSNALNRSQDFLAGVSAPVISPEEEAKARNQYLFDAHEQEYQKILKSEHGKDPALLEAGMNVLRSQPIPSPNYATADDLEEWGKEYIEKTQGGDVWRGVKRGLKQTEGLAYGVAGLAGDLTGVESVRDWGFKNYQEANKEAEKYYKAPWSQDKIDWAQGTVGEVSPSMAVAAVSAIIGTALGGPVGTAVGGAVGGAFGKFLSKKAMEYATKQAVKAYVKKGVVKEVAEELAAKGIANQIAKHGEEVVLKSALKNYAGVMGGKAGIVGSTAALESSGNWGELMEKGIHAPVSSIASGIASGFLELAGGNSRLVESVLGKPAQIAFDKAVGKGLTKKVAEILLETVKQAGEEGIQEAGQEVISIANVALNDPTFETFTKENLSRVGESAAAGALVGGLGGMVPGRSDTSGSTKKVEDPAVIFEKAKVELHRGLVSGKLTEDDFDQFIAQADPRHKEELRGLKNQAIADKVRMDIEQKLLPLNNFKEAIAGKPMRFLQERGGLVEETGPTQEQAAWQPGTEVKQSPMERLKTKLTGRKDFILPEGVSPAQDAAQAFIEQEQKDAALRQSPEGSKKLREDLVAKEKEVAPLERAKESLSGQKDFILPEGGSAAQDSAKAFIEQEKKDLPLRQSPKGSKLLREDLAAEEENRKPINRFAEEISGAKMRFKQERGGLVEETGPTQEQAAWQPSKRGEDTIIEKASEKTSVKELHEMSPTSKEYAEMPVEDVMRKAFGFAESDIKTISPDKLEVKYSDDYDQAVTNQKNSGLSEKKWAETVDLSEPIQLSYEGGKFEIEDGHNRYLAAKILGKDLNVDAVDIKDKPHLTAVKNALAEGKTVSKDVLKYYPELVKQGEQRRLKMPKKLELDLKKQAARKGLKGKRAKAYVYGTLRKTGWKPEREKAS